MPTSTTRPRGRTMARDWRRDSALPTQSTTMSAPPVSCAGFRQRAATWRRTARGSCSGVTTAVGPELAGQPSLVGVLGPGESVPGVGQRAQGGDRGEPERARAEHGHHVAGVDLGGERGVDGAGRRLDHHGVVVAQRVGHGVELAAVRDQAGRGPAAAGVGQ